MNAQQQDPTESADAGDTRREVSGFVLLLWYTTLGAVFASHVILSDLLNEVFGLTKEYPFQLLSMPVIVFLAVRGTARTIKDVGIVAAIAAAAGVLAMAVGTIFVILAWSTFVQDFGGALEHVIILLGTFLSVGVGYLVCLSACLRLGLQTWPLSYKIRVESHPKGDRVWPPHHDPPAPTDEPPQWLQR